MVLGSVCEDSGVVNRERSRRQSLGWCDNLEGTGKGTVPFEGYRGGREHSMLTIITRREGGCARWGIRVFVRRLNTRDRN